MAYNIAADTYYFSILKTLVYNLIIKTKYFNIIHINNYFVRDLLLFWISLESFLYTLYLFMNWIIHCISRLYVYVYIMYNRYNFVDIFYYAIKLWYIKFYISFVIIIIYNLFKIKNYQYHYWQMVIYIHISYISTRCAYNNLFLN